MHGGDRAPRVCHPLGMSNVILTGVDGSSNSNRALDWAITEAEIRKWCLRLVCVFPPAFVVDPVVEASYVRSARRNAQSILGSAAARAEARGVKVEAIVMSGDAASVLVEHSARARLAVVGKRGRGGFFGRLLGSVSSGLAAHSHCPTVVIPQQMYDSATNGVQVAQGRGRSGNIQGGHTGPADVSNPVGSRELDWQQDNTTHGLFFGGQIVAALEQGSAEPALSEAVAAARFHGKPLALVTVKNATARNRALPPSSVQDSDFYYEEERTELSQAVTSVAARYPEVTVRGHTLAGNAAQLLIRLTQTADLMVLGTRGLGGFPGLLLGSVSQAVLHHGRSPMMVVPASERVGRADS